MKVAAYRTRTTKFQGTVWPPMVSGILGSAKNANPASECGSFGPKFSFQPATDQVGRSGQICRECCRLPVRVPDFSPIPAPDGMRANRGLVPE